MQGKTFILLMYGDNIPPHKHINKIIDKYIRYFLKDRETPNYNEAEYIELWIEERYLGSKARPWQYPNTLAIKHEYLSKLIAIFRSFNCSISLCSTSHEHPIAVIDGIEYEGYCYYMRDGKQKIMFIEHYADRDDNKFARECCSQNYCIENKEWYKKLPADKKYKISNQNTNTELEFEQWLRSLMQAEI